MRNLIGKNRFYNWLLWLLGWRLFDRNYCCLWWYRCLCIRLWIWDLTLESVKCWLHGFVFERISFAQSIDCCCLWIFRFLPHVLGTSSESSLEEAILPLFLPLARSISLQHFDHRCTSVIVKIELFDFCLLPLRPTALCYHLLLPLIQVHQKRIEKIFKV